MQILVVGGAGYIGSHAVRECRRAGHSVVVLDNFVTGNPESVDGIETVEGDVHDPRTLTSVFENYRFDAVFHFAASAVVGESMRRPAKYFRDNVAMTLDLVDAMLRFGVERLVFSSTAAVYGEPTETPITEDHPCHPVNPYGRSKLVAEQLLREIARVEPLRFIALRYFNAAGADLAGDIGEARGENETHLIPNVFLTALGKKPKFTIFGSDYDTPDGTCVRDFVHVTDIARAHLAALEHIDTNPNRSYNLGLSEGYSVRQIVDKAREIVEDMEIRVDEAPRREGDPAVLVASSERARDELGWEPQCSDLETILESAWRWHRGHPSGYRVGRARGRDDGQELFGSIAVRLGFVDEGDVSRALERQAREASEGSDHKLIGVHMLELGLLSTSQLIEVLRVYEEC